MRNFFRSNSRVINVSIEDAYKLIKNNKEIFIIDVRTYAEYAQGHIPNAVNIPLAALPARVYEIQAYKDKMILVHCQAGGRSASAVNFLEEAGFNKIYHMYRGFGEWVYETESLN